LNAESVPVDFKVREILNFARLKRLRLSAGRGVVANYLRELHVSLSHLAEEIVNRRSISSPNEGGWFCICPGNSR
jgi:hypothetical protein